MVGLALTTFGVGFGNFFGGSISKLAGGVGQISVQTTAAAYRATIPGLSKIPVIGTLFFSYGFLTYLSVIVAVVMTYFLKKTRRGLNLRAVGESPATADAAGINVSKYKYYKYTVKKGETLVSISRKVYGTQKLVQRIKTANTLNDQNQIYPGQKLIIPVLR